MRPLLMLATALLAACSPVREDWAPVSVSVQAQSEAEIAKACKLALVGRGWEIVGDNPRMLLAQITRNRQTFRIALSYDTRTVLISYVGGRGAYLSPGAYERWVSNLAKDIPVHLKRLQILQE